MEKTAQHPFVAIDVPEEVSDSGIERLIAECGGRQDAYGIRILVNQHGAQEALIMLFAKLDQRRTTALILYYGLATASPTATTNWPNTSASSSSQFETSWVRPGLRFAATR